MEKMHHDYYHLLELRPWVLRHKQASNVLILGEQLANTSEEKLFAAIMHAAGLNQNEIQFITADQNSFNKITQAKPHLIIVMSENISQDTINEFQSLHVPLIVTFHPKHLLKHPKDKKQVYEKLKNII